MNKSDTYKIIFLSSMILIFVGLTLSTDLTNIESIFPQGDSVSIEGDLAMNGNSIISFFDSSCSAGEVVVGVNDDGSYDCIDVSDEVSGDYVDRDGDSMTGALDMQENRIRDVDQISFEVESNDFFSIDDGSDGDNTSPFTMRFDDRDWRLWAGGDDGASTVFVIDHDTGEVNFNHDAVVQEDLEIEGDVTGSSIIDSDQISSGAVGGDELASSYESGSEYDGRFVNQDGDSMSGNLDMSGNTLEEFDSLYYEDGATARLHWDRDKSGDSFYIQRESSSSETYMAIEDGSLSIGRGEASPSEDVHIASNTRVDGYLDMNGNDIENIDQISADEGEFSDSFQVPVGEDAW